MSRKQKIVHVLFYDEKPGIQVIATTSEDFLPDESHSAISRDYEHKRLGMLSLLAGIDLQTGEGVSLVSETNNSRDYIEFLKIFDNKYSEGGKRFFQQNDKIDAPGNTRQIKSRTGELHLAVF